MHVTPLIFSVTRMSLHDGPGSRTVVFFKGCNMRCQWCHNPEGLEAQRSILYNPNKCLHCGACAAVCGNIALHAQVEIDREKCIRCGKCASECVTGALSVVGEEMTAQELVKLILKDRHYYKRTGGGVTFSGGECLLYPEYLSQVLAACREQGVHTLVESALNVPWEHVEQVLPLTDQFFVDVKHMDSEMHRRYTGAGNERILENIRRLASLHPDVAIRIPVIPHVNDDAENLRRTEAFARECGIGRVEKLTYNNLAGPKYAGLGQEYHDFS